MLRGQLVEMCLCHCLSGGCYQIRPSACRVTCDAGLLEASSYSNQAARRFRVIGPQNYHALQPANISFFMSLRGRVRIGQDIRIFGSWTNAPSALVV
ncbi:hypothetical protein BDW68DRAFT_157436 [Aspergillus falconensis]